MKISLVNNKKSNMAFWPIVFWLYSLHKMPLDLAYEIYTRDF